MELMPFTVTQIHRLFDVAQHFVIHLAEKGIVKPYQDAAGRGRSRKFSYLNVLEILICRELSKFQVSHLELKRIITAFHEQAEGEDIDEVLSYMPCILIIKFLNPNLTTEMIGSYVNPDKYWSVGFELDRNIKIINDKDKADRTAQDMSCYFIVDIRNIKRYVDRRI